MRGEGGYDPLELAEAVRRGVARGLERRYYRFRGGRWYGGIATADCVGCNLRCGMCWSWRFSFRSDAGRFYQPWEVAGKLEEIARTRGYKQVRISGGEPTLAREHLVAVLREIPGDLTFILETNGTLIDEGYARELASFPNLVARVSIKGASPEEFHAITLARGEYFYKQLGALRNLVEAGLRPCSEVYPAAMLGFTPEGGERGLARELAKIDARLVECVDVEYVILYPHVHELLKSRGLKPLRAVTPEGVPEFMV